ncbi:Gldg family protein [Chitinophaga arvensicola]|uniref:ABC-2 type transport system permease protein n=1 Tax=Chitinophaga arvensicola TaxID=29529 RepID=A0A1I0PKR7_9BACT|nr:Gldg family protein [Chitinophaga arvensicola]SEW14835.1 ABC-2 type transport system permease protein [Chitinophaga arvensicola]
MRKIFKIAKLELSILIYSPVVWLVLPIFLVLCSMNFIEALQGYRNALSLRPGSAGEITRNIFGMPAGLFVSIQQTLYLYLPILTMGIMSRETSSGSIKLLLSSPVKLRQIILGKYLAMVALGLAFMAILGLFAALGVYSIKDADAGMLTSGLFGLFLLICTYAAIGLFMSCLTNYQIVAAIATLAVFSALRFIGSVGQGTDFIRDLTYFLSISGRTDSMITGLISSKDVAYYIIIISLFLSLSVLYLKNQRELKTWKVKTGRYIALIVVVLIAGYLTSRPSLTGYLDLSAGKQMTISEPSQEIAKKINGKLKITTYVNILAPNPYALLPVFRNGDLESQSMYRRFIPGIENEYVYYYHEVTDSNLSVTKWNPNFQGIKNIHELAEKVALSSDLDIKDFMPAEQIDKLIDLRPEGYFQVRKLEYNGKSTFLRFYTNDEYGPYPFEREWMAALKRLTGDAPRILFVSGNNEAGITDKNDRAYTDILATRTRRGAMINQGFSVDTINLEQQAIPSKVDILVLADPTVSFSDTALQKLKQYINEGGNMLITTNPGRQAIINPVLAALNIQVKPGMLVNPDKDLAKDQIASVYATQATGIDQNVAMIQEAKRSVVLNGAAALAYSNAGPFEVQPLLQSPANGWNKVAPLDENAASLVFNDIAGDEKGVFPVSVTMKRKINNKEQRIIVSGDADYISNVEFSKETKAVRERQFSVDLLFRWLTNGNFPIPYDRPESKDTDLNVSKEQISVINIIVKFVLPALIVLAGIIVLFRRRSN